MAMRMFDGQNYSRDFCVNFYEKNPSKGLKFKKKSLERSKNLIKISKYTKYLKKVTKSPHKKFSID